jgi:DNA polymerase elongation subunit (family B)
MSTRELFIKNKSEILLRKNLSKHFKLPLHNHSEPKLAKSIFLNLLAKKMDVPEYKLSKMRTRRSVIDLSEVILPYVSFNTPLLKKTLSKFKSLKLDGENLKGSFKHKTVYRGLPLSFALGGIHGAKKGMYKSCKDFVILTCDVRSYYPNLAIRNNWSPHHIPKEAFCEIYESFFEDRKLYPKSNPLNYVYKILLNSTYGLSNEDNSFLKDSLFTMQITCNGQLLLVMLLEDLCEKIPGARPVMINTDGIEMLIPRGYQKMYYDICEKWEKMTLLNLDYDVYDRLIIADVNNYIGIFKGKEIPEEKAKDMIKQIPKPLIKKTKDGKYKHSEVKGKGRFEIDKAL